MTIRTTLAADVCGRIGGKEFAVLLADTDAPTATAVAEKLLVAVASAAVPWLGQTLQVTAGIGVTRHRSATLGNLLQHADTATYLTKAGGHNQVVCLAEGASGA